MHKIVIFIPEYVVPLDFILPLEIFSRTRSIKGKELYRIVLCGTKSKIKSHSFQLGINQGIKAFADADTIIVPASEYPMPALPPKVKNALRKAHARGTRIVSICAGAFYLAEAGLLDGKEATTHWVGTNDLKTKYPKIKVNPNVLYVDEGQIMTSAGGCAGIDLCLHIVRKDFGAVVAANTAKFIVMPLERSGGQAQFIEHQLPVAHTGTLENLLPWIEKNVDRALSIEVLAKRSNMSVRTFNRHFKQQTGTTPVKWIVHARVQRARVLLETSKHSLEHIATSVGFGSPITMREHFRTILKTSPSKYRGSFNVRS